MKSIVGVSMIVAAIAVGWIATAAIPAATVSIDQSGVKYLPPETHGIAFIDVAGLRNAPLVKYVLDYYQPTIEGRLPKFMISTGFVPQRDVDRVTIGKIGPRDVVAIIEARYDRFKAEQFMKDRGMEPQGYLGHTMFPIDVQGGQAYDAGMVAFLEGVIVAGQSDAVKKSIDQMSLPGSLPLRSDLMAAIHTIEAGNQVWAVGDFSVEDLPAAGGVKGVAPMLAILKSLQSGTYQMRIDTDIHALATGNFADAQSARNLSDMARGVIAIAKLQVAQKQPDMLRLLDGIRVSSDGPKLAVRIEESGDLLKQLQKNSR